MCSATCAGGKYHAAECGVLRQAGVGVRVEDYEAIDTSYSAITVLRLLLLLQREARAELEDTHVDGEDYLPCLSGSLMDHNHDRRAAQPEVWQYEEDTMVRFLHDQCHMASEWSGDSVHAAHGRILMNATSLELPDDGDHGRGAGLYPIYSMMNTSCRNNTQNTVMPDHTVEIRAKCR